MVNKAQAVSKTHHQAFTNFSEYVEEKQWSTWNIDDVDKRAAKTWIRFLNRLEFAPFVLPSSLTSHPSVYEFLFLRLSFLAHLLYQLFRPQLWTPRSSQQSSPFIRLFTCTQFESATSLFVLTASPHRNKWLSGLIECTSSGSLWSSCRPAPMS